MKLPENWRRVPIKEVYEGLYDGPHATPKPSEEGPVFLGIGNVTEDGHLDFTKVRHISEDDYPKWTKRVTPQRGDIVFTYEATLNRYAIIPEGFRGCLGRRMALIRPDVEKIDTRFLHYYFFSKDWRDTIEANKLAGATVDRVPLTQFPEFPISLPPITVQRRISAILSVYDDLIENNTRRIEILEEIARRLYEEWFVHFRFPGHEEVSFKESELGEIPEGWEVKGLYDIAEVTYGHPFKAKQFNDQGEGLGAVRIRDIRDGQVKTYTTEEGKPKHIIENGDILVGMDGQFHMGKWAGGKAWLVQRVARFRPTQPMSRYLLFLTIERPIKHLEETIVGTTVAHLSAKDLKAMKVVVPDEAMLKMMADALEPMYELEMRLKRKNVNLRAQRDLLLPKLVSGEIDVSDMPMPEDKEVEAA
jgi:type I restriction enzyme S subunit|tara:strand:- start:9756 stop:11009 length:1254 start_codon:yes stop_codon:yes gene_type:complete